MKAAEEVARGWGGLGSCLIMETQIRWRFNLGKWDCLASFVDGMNFPFFSRVLNLSKLKGEVFTYVNVAIRLHRSLWYIILSQVNIRDTVLSSFYKRSYIVSVHTTKLKITKK